MPNRNFGNWLSTFKSSISDYGYYVDFKKVYNNVNSIKVELNILNSLIGSKNIEEDFENIIKEYPKTLRCIPILLAVRDSTIYAGYNGNVKSYDFINMTYTFDEYKLFMRNGFI